MKKTFFSLIAISLLFTSCEKEKPNINQDDQVIVGGLYQDYTQVIVNSCDIGIDISNENYSFNKSEAIYSSHKPTSIQNVFLISLSDTVNNKRIDFQIFTPFMKPEYFFTKSIFEIDTIKIGWSGVTEDFFNADATWQWDTASLEDNKFVGKGTLNITKKIVGQINSDTYYTVQKLDFEFE